MKEDIKNMNEFYAYHVVTERPMHIGQHIIFDETHYSGVYERVMNKLNIVNDIYDNPSKYDTDTLEHHTFVALRELALEEVRQDYIQYILQECIAYMFLIAKKKLKNGVDYL